MTPEEIAVHLTNHGKTLERIEGKVDKTNGTVRELQLWKARVQGAWFVASLAGPVITGLILKFA